MDLVIHHDGEAGRFETRVDGLRCVLEYTRDGRVVTMTHVRVPAAAAGQGVASHLTRTAMDWARNRGLSVVPRCPYVAAWIERNPDYRDLIEPDSAQGTDSEDQA